MTDNKPPKADAFRFSQDNGDNEEDSQQLSDVDSHILELLAKNARLSNAEIGRAVGLSRSATRDHIMDLYEKGVIERFTICVNPMKVGRQLSIFFELQIKPDELMTTVDILVARPEVTDIYLITGHNTLHCHALLKDIAALENFQNTLMSLPGLQSFRIDLLLKRFKTRSGIRI